MNLSKASTLYRSAEFNFKILGNWNTSFKYYVPEDFCSFIREYVLRLVRNTIFAFFIGFVIVCMILTGISKVFLGLALEKTFIDVLGFVGWFLSGVACSVVILYTSVGWLFDHSGNIRIPSLFKTKYDAEGNPIYGPIRTYYKAWKENYCPVLKITE